MTVNHRRKALCCTDGHPATYNDKTIANNDPFLIGLRDGTVLGDMFFDLYYLERPGHDGRQRVGTRRWRGAWVLADNGYHPSWSCCIPPFKRPQYKCESRFSEWVESMRKDVECFFGVLKGRFRILKTGVRFHGVSVCDQVFKTCVALHNYLLECDGGDVEWRRGICLPLSMDEQYGGVYGTHDAEDYRASQNLRSSGKGNVPVLFGRIFGEAANLGERQFRNYDAALDADLLLNPVPADYLEREPPLVHMRKRALDNTQSVHWVCEYHRDVFRDALVLHWDIAWRKHEVIWPMRRGPAPHLLLNPPSL